MSFVCNFEHAAQPLESDRVIVLCAGKLLAKNLTGTGVLLPEYSVTNQWVALRPTLLRIGHLAGRSCWLCVIEQAETPAPSGWEWLVIRDLLAEFSQGQLDAVNCALQLHWWHGRSRFCSKCGTQMEELTTERAMRCSKCGNLSYPSAHPAVIVAVTRGDKILLAHNRNFRPGLFSLLAGFVDPGETLEHAVAREVREEVGIEIEDIRYQRSQAWPFPNSLMMGFRATYRSGEIKADGVEIEEAGWYKRDALPETPKPGTVAYELISAWLRESMADK